MQILIVDDHAVVRQGLKQFLTDSSDRLTAGEAKDGQEALAKLRERDWDLVMLDITMPGQGGIEVLTQIKRLKPDLPVLIFSMHSEDQYAISALKAGASGYLSKDAPPDQILEAIRRVTRGGRYVSPQLAEKLLSDTLSPTTPLPHESLSKREREILLCISRGEALTRIGERLHLSVKTVSTYRARILAKMGMTTNAELTRYVIKHELD